MCLYDAIKVQGLGAGGLSGLTEFSEAPYDTPFFADVSDLKLNYVAKPPCKPWSMQVQPSKQDQCAPC